MERMGEIIMPYYTNGKRGRLPMEIEIMLRMYLLPYWLNLSDADVEDAIYVTLISVPSSTKNAKKKRDHKMHQTQKGNQWHFGMKFHTGGGCGRRICPYGGGHSCQCP